MNQWWNKEIPSQTELFGLSCPCCREEKKYLVNMGYQEGTGPICEECRKHSSVHDTYQPPTVEEFYKRVAGLSSRVKGN